MRNVGTVDIGSSKVAGPQARGLPVAIVPIFPCGSREAMLQLFCSNLDYNHGALQGALIEILFIVNALIRSLFSSKNA